MATIRLFTEQELCAISILQLEAEPTHHLCNVLRARIGDAIVLFNGDGFDYPANVITTGKKTTVEVGKPEPSTTESPLRVHLLQGMCRADRMDYALQKSVELGVASITVFAADKSPLKLASNRLEKKLKHWRGVIRSACEQSGRSTIPGLYYHKELRATLAGEESTPQENSSLDTVRIILSPDGETGIGKLQLDSGSCTVLVGPESGFSDAELQTARDSQFTSISLGPRILRTETAGPAVVGILQALHGDLGG